MIEKQRASRIIKKITLKGYGGLLKSIQTLKESLKKSPTRKRIADEFQKEIDVERLGRSGSVSNTQL